MIESEASWAVFIDYANLSFHQKSAGILDVVTRALIQTPMRPGTTRGRCDVRVYGGWYEDMLITRLAQNLAAGLQNDFPAIVRLKAAGGATLPIVANADLAMALLEEPGQHMFGTYRRKAKAANVRVQDPASVGCADTGCPLPAMKKLLEHGNCTMPGCTIVSADLIYRHEQKLVDTMLTCDLIFAATRGYERIILISGDDDFLPPLRTMLLRGASAVRFHTKPSAQRACFPYAGPQLLEMDL